MRTPAPVYVRGPGLEKGYLGQKNIFEVELTDPDSNLDINIDGPDELQVELFEKSDFLYEVQYETQTPGNYLIRIECDGTPIEKGKLLIHTIIFSLFHTKQKVLLLWKLLNSLK